MKIVKIKGGLGNQLFQYSFLKSLQIKYGCENVKADLSFYNGIKNDNVKVPRIEKLKVILNIASNKELSDACMFKHVGNPKTIKYKANIFLEKSFNKNYYFENDRDYRDLSKILNFKYYDGYWQSWRYMEGIENTLRNEFVLKDKLSVETKKTIDLISNENSVFIGIRRGDYLANNRSRKRFGIFSNDYFNKAVEIIKEKVDNPILYVFSNDIKWVKENMKFNCETVYREDEDQTSDIEELFIMASCKHAIIVNSTFYWWGAWLINNKDKIVIAPDKWFADGSPIDIVPETWIKI